MVRESVEEKGRRYLTEGRLVVEHVAGDVVRARCRGRGAEYALEIPGGSWTKIRERVRGNVTEAASVRDRLLADGLLVNQAAREAVTETPSERR